MIHKLCPLLSVVLKYYIIVLFTIYVILKWSLQYCHGDGGYDITTLVTDWSCMWKDRDKLILYIGYECYPGAIELA